MSLERDMEKTGELSDKEYSVTEKLMQLRDEKYRKFQMPLIPNIAPEAVIGVRTPVLKNLAKDMIKSGEAAGFIKTLPHRFYEENQLHAFIICQEKDFDRCISETEQFLPYIDNWPTCDQFNPKVFSKHKEEF